MMTSVGRRVENAVCVSLIMTAVAPGSVSACFLVFKLVKATFKANISPYRNARDIDRSSLLSRLYRKAEAVEQACLRAQGYPHDYAIRQGAVECFGIGSVTSSRARARVDEICSRKFRTIRRNCRAALSGTTFRVQRFR
jgi:hypothetical protein